MLSAGAFCLAGEDVLVRLVVVAAALVNPWGDSVIVSSAPRGSDGAMGAEAWGGWGLTRWWC